MSTQGIAVIWRSRAASGEPAPKNRLIEVFERYSPSQGWATMGFLLAPLLVVVDSVTAARWVETPGIVAVLFIAALAGLALAKVRFWGILLFLLGIVLGAAVVIWQASSLAEGPSFGARLSEMWSRLTVWYEAATSDGISTDLLPVSLAMLTATWLLGYMGAWSVFRSNNVWVAVVLGGVAILTNLSFLPERFGSRFFLYTFFAMLLVARMHIVQRHEEWRRERTGFTSSGGWLTLHSTLWFSVLVLVLAAVLPLHVYVSRPLANIWKAGRAPVERLEDDFARLFSGVPSRKEVYGRFFGKSLPFLGKISFSGEVVFWADTRYPSYWLSQTYSEYTSKGWRAGETSNLRVGPNTIPPPRGDALRREAVEQSLQLDFSTRSFLAGGTLDWVSREAVVEILEPKQFTIDLLDPSKDVELPTDVQQLAQEFREEFLPPPRDFVESDITRMLPEDLVLVSASTLVDTEDHLLAVERVVLQRKEPVTPEVVAWRFSDTLEANHPYSMISFVSLASDDDLRNAGTEYSTFISDHYLQLPHTLPQRVRDLAVELTAEAETPFDKALVIQDFLRDTSIFTYSQDIDAPPADVDGVDWFLFESRTGYSDYFASAMTVMLRAVGVPARMAAGYAPGEYVPDFNRRVVRDSDSHGWVQVYFPRYGWIDFEPTPAWEPHQRALMVDPRFDPAGRFGPFTEDDLPPDIFDPSIEDLSGSGFIGIGFDIGGNEDPIEASDVLLRSAIAVGALAGIWGLLFLVWNGSLAGASAVEKAYTKMSRLGSMAGISRRSYQTPMEYAAALASAVPTIGGGASLIARAFASSRYSGQTALQEPEGGLEQAWRSIRWDLLAHTFRRFLPRSESQRR